MQKIAVIDEGVIEYGEALKVQRAFFDKHHDTPEEASDVLLYCEHPHVYTLGKSGQQTNLLISDEHLKKIGASFFKTDRGGDITYHGYGQLVGYPILNLKHFGIGLREYIYQMEESVIKTLAEFGIEAFRVDTATGVWVNHPDGGEKKICAIGVKASRHVTMHGFALNVNTDLSYFSYINPCGFTTKGVTSISDMCGEKIDMERVKECFGRHFCLLLGNE